MEVIKDLFNNREIAMGIWLIGFLIYIHPVKPIKEFLKTVIPILLRKQFLIFFGVFISFLGFALYILNRVGFWDTSFTKDTVYWVLFVAIPIFGKAIKEAHNGHFFTKLIRENIAIVVVFEFFVGFWDFGLLIELILVPIMISVSVLHGLSKEDKRYQIVKRFLSGLLVLFGMILLGYAMYSLFYTPNQFFSIYTLKSLLLPVVLLILNLPVIYGLALYSAYEEVFVRMRVSEVEKKKMKWQVIRFAGISLSKISAVRKRMPQPIICCKSSEDLQLNLDKLANRLELRIGENYMKRSQYYVTVCILGLVLSFVGLIGVNSDVTLKDLVTFSFVFDIQRIKEILTYIFSTMLVFSATLLLFAIGFAHKQREDISQIKKYALYELLLTVKKQRSRLADYPPIDDPAELFCAYVLNIYDIKIACDKVLAAYENLLTTWEEETVKSLQFSAMELIYIIGISDEDIGKYTVAKFSDFYNEKVRNAPQSKEFNNFTNMLETDIKKYSKDIEQFCEDFKNYY